MTGPLYSLGYNFLSPNTPKSLKPRDVVPESFDRFDISQASTKQF